MTHAQPLAGTGILITRPIEQAAKAARLIEQAGGLPILFPAIEIRDIDDPERLQSLVRRLEDFDLAIFISPTAVAKALPLIRKSGGLPSNLRVAAVGKGSARALEGFGVARVITPNGGADSEALLDRPELQDVAGQRIILFRGEGGRELLAETLSERGAQVVHAECYRRAIPNADAAPLVEAWMRGEVHAASVTSSESMRNLAQLIGETGLMCLRSTPLFVIHERIATTARSFGIADITVTEPGNRALLDALIDRFAPTRLR